MNDIETNIRIKINKEVTKGKLPIAFYNSLILKGNNNILPNKVNKKYMQCDIPQSTITLLTSKI